MQEIYEVLQVLKLEAKKKKKDYLMLIFFLVNMLLFLNLMHWKISLHSLQYYFWDWNCVPECTDLYIPGLIQVLQLCMCKCTSHKTPFFYTDKKALDFDCKAN